MTQAGDMNRWADNLQTFQRLAGISITPRTELEADWHEMTERQRKFELRNGEEHRIIQDMAIKAAHRR